MLSSGGDLVGRDGVGNEGFDKTFEGLFLTVNYLVKLLVAGASKNAQS